MPAPASQFAEAIVLRDGSPALVRAIRPDDRERLQTAFLALDRESVYLRYFVYKRELIEADLDRLCNPDFALRVVLVKDTSMFTVFGRSGLPMTRQPDEDGVASLTLSLPNPTSAAGTSG